MSFDRPTGQTSYSRSGGKPGSGGYSGKPGFRSQPVEKKPAKFPEGYLANGYMDSDGNYDVNYIDSIAEFIGKQLSDSSSEACTASSKVRAYFDIVESTHSQFVHKKISESAMIASLATLKARVNNSTEKGYSSKFFKQFIFKNVDQVIKGDKANIKANITGFKQHFEAVICYMH